MLNVSYLKDYGYILVRGTDHKTIFKCQIHPANALFGVIWHNRKENESQLVSFAINLKHLERCLKDNLDKENYIKVVIYINTDFKERFKVAQMFAKYGYPVEMKVTKKWQRKHWYHYHK